MACSHGSSSLLSAFELLALQTDGLGSAQTLICISPRFQPTIELCNWNVRLAEHPSIQMTTSPPPAPSSSSIIEVYLADGSWRSVRVDDQTSVHKIIEVVLSAGGIHPISFNHFALCLNHAPHTSNDCQWLHPCLRMPELRRRYIHSAPKGLITRFELRMRSW
uniref:FERM domain-containing protein n=1 Tax=Ditylenchus dipsaci TaxID=166011 RepID=A0A915DY84_9BILA